MAGRKKAPVAAPEVETGQTSKSHRERAREHLGQTSNNRRTRVLVNGKRQSINARGYTHPLMLPPPGEKGLVSQWNRPLLIEVFTKLFLIHRKSLERICAEEKYIDEDGVEWDLPPASTVREIMMREPEFREAMHAIKGVQLEYLLDDLTEQLMDDSQDVVVTESGQVISNNVRNGRLAQLGTHLRWIAAATLHRYRDKQDVNTTFDFGGALRAHIERQERGKLPVEVLREQGSLPLIKGDVIDGEVE